MPYIEAKMSFKLEYAQKDNLHKKLEDVISGAFSKLFFYGVILIVTRKIGENRSLCRK